MNGKTIGVMGKDRYIWTDFKRSILYSILEDRMFWLPSWIKSSAKAIGDL